MEVNLAFLLNPKNNQEPLNSEMVTIFQKSNSMVVHQALPDYSPTPLLSLKEQAQKLGVANIWVKDESKRFGLNAFKGLGGYYALSKLIKDNPYIDHFCTATDGNHGRSLAWSAKLLGKKATIYVPKCTVQERMDNITKEGASLFVVDGNYDITVEGAAQKSKKNGWVLVQDTSWEGYTHIPAMIMAGYFTLCQEIIEQLSQQRLPDLILLQSGVGSFPASLIWYFKDIFKEQCPKFVIVEPSASCGAFDSMVNKKRQKPESPDETIMAGLNCGIPSSIAWPILANDADGFMKINDDMAKKAMKVLAKPINNDPKIVSGESGVAGFAGCIQLLQSDDMMEARGELGITKHSTIMVINTEGDTDAEAYQVIIKED